MVRLRRGRIDHQHVLACAVLARQHDVGRRGVGRVGVAGERLLPAFEELFLVDHLVALGAAVGVGARTDAFEMHHHRGRLVQHAQAGSTHLHRQIGVFVIGRGVIRIKAAELAEQVGTQRNRCTRAVIDLAHEIVFGLGRVVETAVVPARAIGKHDATGFLQPAIRIHQLGPDQTDIAVLLEGVDQRIQPAVLHRGVVVEEYDELPARIRRAGVAGADEAGVLRIALVAQTLHAGQHRGRIVAGAVVDQDDFVCAAVLRLRQRLQADQGGIQVVVDRDHDADQRCFRGRQHEAGGIYRGGKRNRGGLHRRTQFLTGAVQRAAQAARAQAVGHPVAQGQQPLPAETQACQGLGKLPMGITQRAGQTPGAAGQDRIEVALHRIAVGDGGLEQYTELAGFFAAVGQLILQRQRPMCALLELLVQLHEVGARLFDIRLHPLRPFGAFVQLCLQCGGPVGALHQFGLLFFDQRTACQQRGFGLGAGVGQGVAAAGLDRIGGRYGWPCVDRSCDGQGFGIGGRHLCE